MGITIKGGPTIAQRLCLNSVTYDFVLFVPFCKSGPSITISGSPITKMNITAEDFYSTADEIFSNLVG
jgi:hypothetical protein